jgi:hypothetical protein
MPASLANACPPGGSCLSTWLMPDPLDNACLVQPYFAAPDFNYESAKKASGNVAGLRSWADAMCKYHVVAKVAPAVLCGALLHCTALRCVAPEGHWSGRLGQCRCCLSASNHPPLHLHLLLRSWSQRLSSSTSQRES